MSILSRLFGNTAPPAPEPVDHAGCAIFADPVAEGGKWRLAARIVKTVGGAERTHRLIRADLLDSRDAAVAASVAKARQVIDEQGDGLFAVR